MTKSILKELEVINDTRSEWLLRVFKKLMSQIMCISSKALIADRVIKLPYLVTFVIFVVGENNKRENTN